MRGVESAAHADDGLRPADGAHALHEPRHLDVEGLVAVLREARRVVGHEREPVERAAQSDVPRRRVELEVHGAELPCAEDRLHRAAIVVERPLPEPILTEAVEVDIRHRSPRAVREALRLGEERAALVDHRLAVPRQVVRRLAHAGSGIRVCGEAAQRLRLAEVLAVLGAGDRDRAAAEVEQHGRARRAPPATTAGSAPRRPRTPRRGRRGPGRRAPRTAGRVRTAPRGRRRGCLRPAWSSPAAYQRRS